MSSKIIEITEINRTPLVDSLLRKIEERDQVIDEQHEAIRALKEQIQALKDEIAALKKSPNRPKFGKKSNKKSKSRDSNDLGKRPGSTKRKKKSQLRVDDTKVITPPDLPEGSKLKRTRRVVIQNLVLKSFNTRYVLEEWESPSGELISAQIPKGVSQDSFGNDLCRFILYQYHHCQVTQPLIYEQLQELGVDISVGQINRILTENKDIFHDEKGEILRKGLEISEWIQTDDTGARHKGKTGYCTHIGNNLFAWFGSLETKSRINFLSILNGAFGGKYKLDSLAFRYMEQEKLPKGPLNKLRNSIKLGFKCEDDWSKWLINLGIVKPRHIKIATEAALFSGAIDAGLNRNLIILSDDAGQFNIPLMIHALCWVHEARHIKELVPISEEGRLAQEKALEGIWAFYEELKTYCLSSSKKHREAIWEKFDWLFNTRTCFSSLNLAMKRIYGKKQELLVILDHPDAPLHNNGSEGDIREFVKRRKMSGGTRSAAGRQCRDTFASLKKTCRKLGISFWNYLGDRLSEVGNIKKLAVLMEEKAAKNSLISSTPKATGVLSA
jgi:hypothetical protein